MTRVNLIVITVLLFTFSFSTACSGRVQEENNKISKSPSAAPTISPSAVTPAQTRLTRASTELSSPTPLTIPDPTMTAEFYPVCSPLEGIKIDELASHINNPYHPPRPGVDDPHMGIDFAIQEFNMAVSGRPVNAVLSGKIAMVLDDRFPYGNAVMVETTLNSLVEDKFSQLSIPTPSTEIEPHPALNCPSFSIETFTDSQQRSLYVLYAHLETSPEHELDSEVSCGETIGILGGSGNALNPHLHLEARVGPSGLRLGSMAHYSTSASPQEMSAYCIWRVTETFQLIDPMTLIINSYPETPTP